MRKLTEKETRTGAAIESDGWGLNSDWELELAALYCRKLVSDISTGVFRRRQDLEEFDPETDVFINLAAQIAGCNPKMIWAGILKNAGISQDNVGYFLHNCDVRAGLVLSVLPPSPQHYQ